jgi:tetratricopeptide (TPR) repeat protein
LSSRGRALALLLASGLQGCAHGVRAPVPEGVDLVYPSFPPGALRGGDARQFQDAWSDVLTGHADAASRSFEKLRARHPEVVGVDAGLGYARLRANDSEAAASCFDAALQRDPRYLPALLGAGAAARRRADADAALGFYRRALEVAPDDALGRRRLAEVKLQLTERHVAAAQAARQGGDDAQANAELKAVLQAAPELADVRVELANSLYKAGDGPGAVALLEEHPTRERHVLLALGELQLALGNYPKALEAYRHVLELDPRDAEALQRVAAAREASELAQMPAEYRRIPQTTYLSRADLAALIAVKVTALQRLPGGEGRVATDISGSWARDQILRVLSLEVMDIYPNHTFQPGAVVRRGDLALAAGRVLDLLGVPSRPAPALKDMSPASLLYSGATRVVAAGLMDVTPDGAFEAWRPVSGRDAVAVLEALARLVGP